VLAMFSRVSDNFFMMMNSDVTKIPNRATLPVLKRLTTAYRLWHEIMPTITKTSRYTLGERVDRLFLEIMEYMYIASFLPKEQKLPYLQQAVGKLDLLKFFLQLSWEIKVLDNKKYIALTEPLEETGRMLGGWTKQVATAPKETSAPKK